MVLGLVQYVAGGRHLGEAGLQPGAVREPGGGGQHRRRLWGGLGGGRDPDRRSRLVARDVTARTLSDVLGVALLVTVVVFFSWLFFAGGWTPVERKRLFVVGVLFAASALFWCVFEQAGSTLNLFAERSTDKNVLGFTFPSSWLQSMNALFIIALAPVFGWIWLKLGTREPSSPAKFVSGAAGGGVGLRRSGRGGIQEPWAERR